MQPQRQRSLGRQKSITFSVLETQLTGPRGHHQHTQEAGAGAMGRISPQPFGVPWDRPGRAGQPVQD